jgi:hypothetical protein
MFKVPENYRIKTGKFKSSESFGNNGAFIVPYKKRMIKSDIFLQVISSDGYGWEHVSVVPVFKSGKPIGRVPTWEEMDFIKNLFWSDSDKPEIVIQIHVPKMFNINFHPNCLHLWKKIGSIYELPPKILI